MLDNLKKYKKVKSIKLSKKYHCPRCGSELIEVYRNYFECLKCLELFEKDDCDRLDDSEILSVDEKYFEEELQELEEQLQQKLERDKVDSKHPEKLMDCRVTRSSLERAIEFISQLELTEEDYEEIFNKFKPFLKSQAPFQCFSQTR